MHDQNILVDYGHFMKTSLKRKHAMAGLVEGKKGIIIGIANERSIAWGCAEKLHQEGAHLAITYLNDKAKPFVEPLAQSVNADLFMPYEVSSISTHQALFDAVKRHWESIDFLIHSIAFAPKEDLQGALIHSSREGFLEAVDISCHSLIRLAKSASQIMPEGGCILTMSYYGAEKVIPHYNLMGPIKALLESSARYLASELGERKIRVNVISPGPISTRAASGLVDFERFLIESHNRAPLKEGVSPHDVGALATFLISDAAARLTGECLHIDAGLSIMG